MVLIVHNFMLQMPLKQKKGYAQILLSKKRVGKNATAKNNRKNVAVKSELKKNRFPSLGKRHSSYITRSL